MVPKLDLDGKREHALGTLHQLDQMKKHQQHCDFIVSVNGNKFHVHRNVLSAGSDYFNAMLAPDTKESQLGMVEMKGIDCECAEICLNYIYTGKAEIPEGKTEQLISIASLMQLHKVSNAILQLLNKSLDTSTFYRTRARPVMVRKLELDETEHALGILHQLGRMKKHQQHCDFIVSADGKEFHVHRNVLSAGSDYFNAMLAPDTNESQLGMVEMKGIDSECVEICLNYIYTGKAEIPEGKTEQLISITSLMQLHKLSNAILQLLNKSLDTSAFYRTRRIAEMCGIQDLLAKCRAFEQKNILSLSSQDDFLAEQKSRIVEILTFVGLTEKEKLILSLRWITGFKERKCDLLDFLTYINLKVIPENFLLNILQSNPYVRNDFDLYKIFNGLLIKKLKSDGNDNFESNSLIIIDGTSQSLLYLNLRNNNVEKFHDEKFAESPNCSAVAMDSYIYILSVNKSVHRLKFWENNAKWEKMQEMIEYHGDYPPLVSLKGFLYVIGSNFDQATSVAEKFYISENRWVRLKDKPIATAGAALASMGGFIYSIGGETEERVLNAFYKFGSQSKEWTELESMPQAKTSCGCTAVNQKIYVFGGWTGKEACSHMDCYDVSLKQWTRLSPMIRTHYFISAHHVSGWIYAVKRFEDSGTIEKYNIKTDKWQRVEITGIDNFQIHDSVLI